MYLKSIKMFSDYNIKIFGFLVVMSILIGIISNNIYHFVNFNVSRITLKINGGNDRKIFSSETDFHKNNHPDNVIFNGQSITPTNGAYSFDNDINLVILEWSQNRLNYSHIFHGCSAITEIDLSLFETSQVRWMGSMFRGCKSLTSINFNGFVTSNVEDMGFMFQDCKRLTSIDLSGFDTSKVTLMWKMFEGCTYLSSLDLSKFVTSKVTSMEAMFSGCSSITSLDLSKFDTSKVESMKSMFEKCKLLTSLNLNSFHTDFVTSMENLFYNCVKLRYINLYNFGKGHLSSVKNMFESVPGDVIVCLKRDKIDEKIIKKLEIEKASCSIIEECKQDLNHNNLENENNKNIISDIKYNIKNILTEIDQLTIDQKSNEYYASRFQE